MVTPENPKPAWYLQPFAGESVSHYFGRFRRQPEVSIPNPSQLSQLAEIGPALFRWEQFYFNPPPTQIELEALAQLISLDVEQLAQMFPPPGERTLHRSIRLCAACYREAPYHRREWQFQSVEGCEKHQLRFLSRCPGCKTKIALPRDWVQGVCLQCGMKFTSMVKYQKKMED